MEDALTAAATEQPSASKQKYLTKLLPYIQHRGFSQLRIETIVQAMDISKATFYKHFTSKEDVIGHIVALIVTALQEATARIADDSLPYEARFQRIFEQSLLIATYLTDNFLRDLQQAYPPLWEQIKQAQRERQRHLATFFAQGVAAGIFQPIPLQLAVLQDELLLRKLLDPLFLMDHDLTLRLALTAYYDLQKYQWCVPAVRVQLDDTAVQAYITMMADKIASSLRSDAQR